MKSYTAIKIRIYPDTYQQEQLARAMGCSRWWWNYALNLTITTYKKTGKSISKTGLNSLLPKLKKDVQTEFLKTDVYSQSLQQVTENLSKAFQNFFEKRAKFPRFKSYYGKQVVSYPQNVKCLVDKSTIKLPKIGEINAVYHRPLKGVVKTVTVSKNRAGQYFASIRLDIDQEIPVSKNGVVTGIDLGIKEFAITYNGNQCSKYDNPRYTEKYARNLKRKQQKLARKQPDSSRRKKARLLVAKVHNKIYNTRHDFLHKLSRKIVDTSQTVVVENLHVKGMVKNHKLAKAISDTGWGTFVNFLAYKLENVGKKLIEIDRFFPSSKTCSNCLYQLDELNLAVREWVCPHCGANHDRDENAAKNIRAEGIRLLSVLGTSTAAKGGDVRQRLGRKVKTVQSPMSLEASALPVG